jgi:hypothetical protein
MRQAVGLKAKVSTSHPIGQQGWVVYIGVLLYKKCSNAPILRFSKNPVLRLAIGWAWRLSVQRPAAMVPRPGLA